MNEQLSGELRNQISKCVQQTTVISQDCTDKLSYILEQYELIQNGITSMTILAESKEQSLQGQIQQLLQENNKLRNSLKNKSDHNNLTQKLNKMKNELHNSNNALEHTKRQLINYIHTNKKLQALLNQKQISIQKDLSIHQSQE